MKTEKLRSVCQQHVVIRFKVKKFVNKYLQRWFVYITCDTLELIIIIWYYLNICYRPRNSHMVFLRNTYWLGKTRIDFGKTFVYFRHWRSSGVLPDCIFSKISTNFLKFQKNSKFSRFQKLKKKSKFLKDFNIFKKFQNDKNQFS